MTDARRTELTAYRSSAEVIIDLVGRLEAGNLSRPGDNQLKTSMEIAISKINQEFLEDAGNTCNLKTPCGVVYPHMHNAAGGITPTGI